MGMGVDFMVLLVFVTAVISTLLQYNIVGASDSNKFYCHGDYCRTDEPTEFCSETYRICRPCTDILDDCLSSQLPRNCSSTCIRHKVEQQMKELQGTACPVLTEITHGKHNGSLTDTHKPGEVIEYTCDKGFRLHGDGYRECRQYGYWSNDIPTCKEPECQILPSVANGMHNGSSNTWTTGTVVVTSCAVGHQMHGKSTTVCNSDGVWSNSLPVCKRITCMQPHPIRNGIWLYSHKALRRYVSGHILRAECEQGYVMDGQPEWNCTDEGYWESSGSLYMPVCFLKGKLATVPSIAWYIALGVALVSVSSNVYLLFRKRLICCFKQQMDENMVPHQKNSDIDVETFNVNEESRRLLEKEVISLRDQKQPREKVVLSGESNIPAPNTYNSQSKEPPGSSSNTDTPQRTPENVTVNIFNNNNNNTVQNTVQKGTIFDSADQQTTPNSIPTADDTSRTTQTAPPKTVNDDKAPVEESGISCIPSQPESSGGTLPNQSELSEDILPNQSESSSGALQNQSESSGGIFQNQSGSLGGTFPSQSELSDGTLPRQTGSSGGTLQSQSETSHGILLSHQDFGATVQSQNESLDDTDAIMQQMSTVTDAPDDNEESNATTPV